MNAVRIYFCIKKLKKKVSVSTGPLFVTINSHKMQCNLENKILLLKAQLYYIKPDHDFLGKPQSSFPDQLAWRGSSRTNWS